jgi:hypothetical protein
MSVKKLSISVISIALCAGTFTALANNDSAQVWTPGQPVKPNLYWQSPNRPDPNTQRPAPSSPPAYKQKNNYNGDTPPPPPGPYSGSSAPRNPAPVQRQTQPAQPNYGGAQVQQRQVQRSEPYYRNAPAQQARPPVQRYNGPSAYYTPGYNPYRDYRRKNDRWGSNKFWGNSGPSKWMSPNKRNWENSWDDMINAPSRMGEMPGGWTAPEVSVPNPIDMGDQMQDNVRDLPDQMKDGNIGNDVSN